jgi:hypothetical protein
MMKNAFLCLAAMMSLVVLSVPASAGTKVFLLAGQSNMAGEGGYAGRIPIGTYPWTTPPYDHGADAPCPAPYNQPLAAVKFWNYAGGTFTGGLNNPGVGNGWVDLACGYGTSVTTGFGPELSFGARIHEMFPNDEIYLVKYGLGGTSLAANWNPTGNCYTMFKSRVNTAMATLTAAGKNPEIAGMLWMQGEDDTTNPSYAAAYAQNLKNLVTKTRLDFNAPDMAFVAGRITYMTEVWTTRANIDLVRNAQWNIASQSTNASCINTDDLEWAYYGHYGTQGQIDLGNRFANQFVVPEPSTLTLASVGLLGLLGYAWRKHR